MLGTKCKHIRIFISMHAWHTIHTHTSISIQYKSIWYGCYGVCMTFCTHGHNSLEFKLINKFYGNFYESNPFWCGVAWRSVALSGASVFIRNARERERCLCTFIYTMLWTNIVFVRCTRLHIRVVHTRVSCIIKHI